MINTRNARSEDAKQIAEIYREVWSKYSEKIDKNFLKLIIEDEEKVKKQIEKSIFLVAELDNRIIGVIRGNIEWGGIAKLSMIAVLPEFRRRGAGKELLNAFLRELKKQDIHKVYLYTHKALNLAIELYNSFNFEILLEFKNFWGHENFLLMVKELN